MIEKYISSSKSGSYKRTTVCGNLKVIQFHFGIFPNTIVVVCAEWSAFSTELNGLSTFLRLHENSIIGSNRRRYNKNSNVVLLKGIRVSKCERLSTKAFHLCHRMVSSLQCAISSTFHRFENESDQ